MIERNIQINYNGATEPIDYVQGSNALEIQLNLIDYEIPAGATSATIVIPPTEKARTVPTTISGNTIIISPTAGTFTELGFNKMQVSVVAGDKTLVTFVYNVNVKENLTGTPAEPSPETEPLLTEILNVANAMKTATEEAEEATINANNATAQAVQATQTVETALQNVETAITSANTATTNANTATTNANNATAELTQALDDVENAIDSANTATSNANTATSNANTATSRANTATSNANSAATNANNAATNANAAAAKIQVTNYTRTQLAVPSWVTNFVCKKTGDLVFLEIGGSATILANNEYTIANLSNYSELIPPTTISWAVIVTNSSNDNPNVAIGRIYTNGNVTFETAVSGMGKVFLTGTYST